MIRTTVKRFFSKITSDLSNDFLVTLSMSHQSFKADSHFSLIKTLYDNGVLTNLNLQATLNKLDRGFFLPEDKKFKLKKSEIYANAPVHIGFNQNMTDVFTHSYSLQVLYPILKQILETNSKIKIADFGTGSGYIAFALYDLASELIQEIKSNDREINIMGYDIYDDFVERNKKMIKSKFINYSQNIKMDFITKNLDEINLEEKDFNIIYIGFAVTFEKLKTYSNLLANNGTILAPILNQNSLEQDLSLIKKENGQIKVYKILKCMFSDMLNEKNKNDYQFFGGEEINTNSEPEQEKLYDNANNNILDKKINDLKAELEINERELKQILNQCKGSAGKIPPLSELNKISNFSKLLNLINSKKKQIKTLMDANKKI